MWEDVNEKWVYVFKESFSRKEMQLTILTFKNWYNGVMENLWKMTCCVKKTLSKRQQMKQNLSGRSQKHENLFCYFLNHIYKYQLSSLDYVSNLMYSNFVIKDDHFIWNKILKNILESYFQNIDLFVNVLLKNKKLQSN